jgi:hypothetical protein
VAIFHWVQYTRHSDQLLISQTGKVPLSKSTSEVTAFYQALSPFWVVINPVPNSLVTQSSFASVLS